MTNVLSKNMKKAADLIKKKKNIFIVSHINPDGDNIGSMLALYLALEKMGKNVTVLKADFLPEDFKFLTGYDNIKKYEKDMDSIDILIAVDCSDEERLGNNKDLLKISKHIINIDHHISNNMFGNINIVDPDSAATGEIIYDFVKFLGIKIDPSIGENIYTAISTDTGKFSYESVSSKTHRIVSELIDIGTNTHNVNIQIYENMSMEKTNLFLKVLSNLETYENDKIAVACITQDMLYETNTTLEDSEGIISFLRKISTVEIACLLKEIEEKDIKVSLRSKSYVDVSKICKDFGGGGHKRAAGCSISSSIDKAKNIIVEKLQKSIR